MDQSKDHMKMNVEYFQIQKWMSQTGRVEKEDGKNGVVCPIYMFPFIVMVLRLSKKVYFFGILCWPHQEI